MLKRTLIMVGATILLAAALEGILERALRARESREKSSALSGNVR